jgi:uncharacterized protein (TIGR03083 family)
VRPPDGEHVGERLGAWALRACPPGEARGIEEHLASCPGCAKEAARLADWYGAAMDPALGSDLGPVTVPGIAGASTLTGRLRDPVLVGTLDGRTPSDRRVSELARPYAEQVGRLDALLSELTPRRWPTGIPVYGDVPGLLAHLAANDAALLGELRSGAGGSNDSGGSNGSDGSNGNGAAQTEGGTLRDEAEARLGQRAWREQAVELLRVLSRIDADRLDAPAPMAGRSPGRAALRDAIVQRGMETWIHLDDLHMVLGLDRPVPSAHQVRLIAELAVRRLPPVLPENGVGSIRLRLDGPGGGQWRVPGRGGPTEVRVEADAVDFCRLCGNRRRPPALRAGVEGPARSIAEILWAATTLGCD